MTDRNNLTNDVTLGELLELQRSIPRGGSSFYVESSLLARMLAELVRARTAVEPREDLRTIIEEIVANGGNDPNASEYLGEEMLVRIRSALNRPCSGDAK